MTIGLSVRADFMLSAMIPSASSRLPEHFSPSAPLGIQIQAYSMADSYAGSERAWRSKAESLRKPRHLPSIQFLLWKGTRFEVGRNAYSHMPNLIVLPMVGYEQVVDSCRRDPTQDADAHLTLDARSRGRYNVTIVSKARAHVSLIDS